MNQNADSQLAPSVGYSPDVTRTDRFGQNVSSGDLEREDSDAKKLEIIESVDVSEEEKRALEGGPALMDPRDLAVETKPVELNDEPAKD